MRRWLGKLLGGLRTSCSLARVRKLLILLAGLILPQLIIFAPSFFGGKVALPVDILARMYGVTGVEVRDRVMCDPVFVFEPWRHFAASELAAGRVALWNPHIFGGVPFSSTTFSPFQLLYAAWSSPYALVWIQLIKTLFAGLGAYLLLRRALQVGFWPATIAAWCLPLTGFYTVWQASNPSHAVAYLPWMLLAVHTTMSRPRGCGVIGLAGVTALVLICGQPDISMQVLLASGLYAILLLVGTKGMHLRSMLRPGLTTAGGWLAGFMLAAPQWLPWVEYILSGARAVERASGFEARPPTGLSALPQLLIPNFYGTTQAGWTYLGALNVPESAASGFAGLIVTLFLAPLAWCDRSRRRESFFWLGLAVFALGWTLNIPGLVSLLRLPVLNMMSHNRFVFLSSFALIVLAALGLEALRKIHATSPQPISAALRTAVNGWFALPVAVLLTLLAWCAWRWQVPPPQLFQGYPNPVELERVLENFRGVYLQGVVMCALGLVAWASVFCGIRIRPWNVAALLAAMLVEYLIFAAPFNSQNDPALYYPERPLFARLREMPGRVLPMKCWPPNILSMHGLHEIRGYDGVDPKRMMQVLNLGEDAQNNDLPNRPRTVFYVPLFDVTAEGQIRLRPVLNMLNVRWLIFYGSLPETRPVLLDAPYSVVENVAALPRAFVPHTVQPCPGEQAALPLIGAADFDPVEIAYVDGSTQFNKVSGRAKLVSEVPNEVTVRTTMETAGMVVLGDQWYPGWRAWVDGRETEVHRVNHVLRGVSVPAGSSMIIFRYQPASFTTGVWLMSFSAAGLVAWALISRRKRPALSSPFSPGLN